LGNICRSPLAEGILKRKVKMNNLDWQVDSAGTGGWHVGALPDSRSIQVARKNGIDITDQRARKFQTSDLDQFDLIFAMDSSNYQNIVRHSVSDDQKEKVQLIMNMVQPGMNESVPDPYWDDNGFDQVFHMLEEACDQVIEKFRG
jgi:protein-tyrosine phosphatase